MNLRCNSFILIAGILLGAGCKKDQPPEGQLPASTEYRSNPSAPPEIIARIHWLGKRQIAMDTNSHDLIIIWNVPESARLEAQTLDKLSRSLWPLFHLETDTNASKRLRPLLNDVLQEESCLEVRAISNEPGELAFAIKLNDEQAVLWNTNLALVVQSLTGIQPVPATGENPGWSLKKPRFPKVIELTRADGWTILGAAKDHNDLVRDFVARITRDHSPFGPATTNTWLTADLDPRKIARAFELGWNLPTNTPTISLTASGDGQFVHTKGELNFPQPLPLNLEPWNIPTNLIHGDVSSFTAVRGFKTLLESCTAWKDLQIGTPPNEMVFWGLHGLPAQIYFAAPVADASNRVEQIADRILQKSPSWFPEDGTTGFEKSTRFNGVSWKGTPYLYPFLKSTTINEGDFVFGGSVVVDGNDLPPPQELIGGVFDRTNLVYHDREYTGGQILQWIYISQFIRFASHKAQLPENATGLLWLKAMVPLVGSSGTDISQTGPAQLSFARTSGIGFTAIELNLLADWLESPQFPFGLNTFTTPPAVQP